MASLQRVLQLLNPLRPVTQDSNNLGKYGRRRETLSWFGVVNEEIFWNIADTGLNLVFTYGQRIFTPKFLHQLLCAGDEIRISQMFRFVSLIRYYMIVNC